MCKVILDGLEAKSISVDRKSILEMDREFERLIKRYVYDDGKTTIHVPLVAKFGMSRLGASDKSILSQVVKRGRIADLTEAMVVRDYLSGPDLKHVAISKTDRLETLLSAFENRERDKE